MRKLALFIVILLAIGILISVLNSKKSVTLRRNEPSLSPSTLNQNTPAETIVADNLDIPWAIVFLPDSNSMLVTERSGNLAKIENGSKKTIARLNITTGSNGEGGLLGLALDPNFSSNHLIYFYYTYLTNGNNTQNRVVRFKLENDKLTDEKILVDHIAGALFHNGGRIKFGPDGFLYVTTGDAQNPSRAQDKNSLSGKILRITTDGKPAPGNPFGTSVYSFGHRNPQGLAWDDSGKLWATEHGPSNAFPNCCQDELNQIEPGKNYGWPEVTGKRTKAGMVTPVINSGQATTWAPAGVIFLKGSIVFGGLKGSAIYEYKISENKLVEHLKNKYGRIRDVELGPDGMIYITTSNRDGRGSINQDDDKIIKINPQKLPEI